ncbi:MAG: hydrogenase/urease maturation nickel metallochaperone HypA [Oscillospiraceae bacterium]
MHELAITEAVIDLINREAREKGFSKVLSISLRVGSTPG